MAKKSHRRDVCSPAAVGRLPHPVRAAGSSLACPTRSEKRGCSPVMQRRLSCRSVLRQRPASSRPSRTAKKCSGKVARAGTSPLAAAGSRSGAAQSPGHGPVRSRRLRRHAGLEPAGAGRSRTPVPPGHWEPARRLAQCRLVMQPARAAVLTMPQSGFLFPLPEAPLHNPAMPGQPGQLPLRCLCRQIRQRAPGRLLRPSRPLRHHQVLAPQPDDRSETVRETRAGMLSAGCPLCLAVSWAA